MTTFYRRRLPHYHSAGHALFLTWRLHGSLPANRNFSTGISTGAAFVAMDRLLDHSATGPLFLRIPEIAALTADAICHRDQPLQHYKLHSWVVMPNHVHLLITPLIAVSKIMQSLKRFTATQANRMLSRTGQPFWQEESYDRLVRDEREFQRITNYIEMNPVNAKLATAPERFRWSSASCSGAG